MTGNDLIRRAARIERELRAEGVPALLIPGLIAAAFAASLTNLPIAERRLVLEAHLGAMQAMLQDLREAAQAPDGPMPDDKPDLYLPHSR